MTKKYTRIAAAFTIFATMFVMSATISPAFAAPVTDASDVLAREQTSQSGGHTLKLTLPADLVSNTITFNYSTAGFTSVSATPSVTCGAGSATAASVANVITVTGGGACTGLLTVTFTATNPGSSGDEVVPIAGTAGDTGSFAIPIVDHDQITVSASVDPSITFIVGADPSSVTCGTAWTLGTGPSTYSVPLGTLTTGSVTYSNNAGINHICTKVSTNAAGVAVTVKESDPNGGSGGNYGLASSSVTTDMIKSTSAAHIAAGTANFGICTVTKGEDDSTIPASAPVTEGVFSEGCGSGAGDTIVAFSGASQSLWTTGGPVASGYLETEVAAAISPTTAAHSDYSATLTFIATGTF
jgi:hypothetical protein